MHEKNVTLGFCQGNRYYWMNEWLSGFAYHIDISWWMFATGIVLTWCITILTISYQTIRAATANPVEALRNN